MKYLMFVFLVLFICFLLFIEPITYFFWSAILLGARHPLEVLVVCSLITFILVVLIGRPMKKSPKGPYRDWDNTLAIYNKKMKLKPANNKTDCVTALHIESKESRILHLPYFLRPFSSIPSIRQGSPTTHFYLSLSVSSVVGLFFYFFTKAFGIVNYFSYISRVMRKKLKI